MYHGLDDAWVKIVLEPYIQIELIHMAGWNFDLVDCEACQFTIYNQGQYYGWHTDTDGNLYYGKGNEWNKLMRKLSVTVSLSDPEDYEGGVLEFDLRNTGQINTSEIINVKKYYQEVLL